MYQGTCNLYHGSQWCVGFVPRVQLNVFLKAKVTHVRSCTCIITYVTIFPLQTGSHTAGLSQSSLLNSVEVSVQLESDNESTAGELDLESTTTDPGSITASIPAHCKLTNTQLQNQKVTISAPRLGLHQYENWSMILNISDESIKRGRFKRMKGSRVGVRLRERAPQPLPR